LSKQDISRIEKAGYEGFIYTDNLGNNYLKDKNRWCMFLVRGKKSSCKIHGVRPKICRQYPSELIHGSCKPVELAFDKFIENK